MGRRLLPPAHSRYSLALDECRVCDQLPVMVMVNVPV